METAAAAARLHGADGGRGAVWGCRRGRQERRAGDRSAAAGGDTPLPGADPAQDFPTAERPDRQDDALLPASVPTGKVQRQRTRLDLSERGENLFRQYAPGTGPVQLPGPCVRLYRHRRVDPLHVGGIQLHHEPEPADRAGDACIHTGHGQPRRGRSWMGKGAVYQPSAARRADGGAQDDPQAGRHRPGDAAHPHLYPVHCV